MQNLTKLLHILLIICFFLPFIPTGCEGGATSEIADSAAPVIKEPAPAFVDTAESVADFQDSAGIDSFTSISPAETSQKFINEADTAKKEGNKVADFILFPDKKKFLGGRSFTYFPYLCSF